MFSDNHMTTPNGVDGDYLSVLMPVYNEAPRIREVLAAVRSVPLEVEIVIVDDCSTDGTTEILKEEAASDDSIKLIHHDRNRGKGAAVRSAREHATGRVVVIQDGDTEYDPHDYPKLVAPIFEGRARAVFGSRFKGNNENMHPLNLIANKFLTWQTNLLYRTGISDACTAYKALDAGWFKSVDLSADGFEFCHELAVKLSDDGIKVIEVPISYHARRASEGKKVGWRQLFISSWLLFKMKLARITGGPRQSGR